MVSIMFGSCSAGVRGLVEKIDPQNNHRGFFFSLRNDSRGVRSDKSCLGFLKKLWWKRGQSGDWTTKTLKQMDADWSVLLWRRPTRIHVTERYRRPAERSLRRFGDFSRVVDFFKPSDIKLLRPHFWLFLFYEWDPISCRQTSRFSMRLKFYPHGCPSSSSSPLVNFPVYFCFLHLQREV